MCTRCSTSFISSHLSLNREGRWGTTNDFATSFLHFFPVLHCPLGLGELLACPFPDVVFPLLPLSALSSSPFHCALLDGFGQTWRTGHMTIPLQFASLYDGQEVFLWCDCLLDLGTDLLVGNMIFVWDAASALVKSNSELHHFRSGRGCGSTWMWHCKTSVTAEHFTFKVSRVTGQFSALGSALCSFCEVFCLVFQHIFYPWRWPFSSLHLMLV